MKSKKMYKIDDIVTDGEFTMKVVTILGDDEGGNWWYECAPVDFWVPFPREFRQDRLKPAEL